MSVPASEKPEPTHRRSSRSLLWHNTPLARQVLFPEAVRETEVAGIPVSVPRLCADRWLLTEVGFKSRGSEGNNDATLHSGRFRLCAYHSLSAK